jgi:hypothetical protein
MDSLKAALDDIIANDNLSTANKAARVTKAPAFIKSYIKSPTPPVEEIKLCSRGSDAQKDLEGDSFPSQKRPARRESSSKSRCG